MKNLLQIFNVTRDTISGVVEFTQFDSREKAATAAQSLLNLIESNKKNEESIYLIAEKYNLTVMGSCLLIASLSSISLNASNKKWQTGIISSIKNGELSFPVNDLHAQIKKSYSVLGKDLDILLNNDVGNPVKNCYGIKFKCGVRIPPNELEEAKSNFSTLALHKKEDEKLVQQQKKYFNQFIDDKKQDEKYSKEDSSENSLDDSLAKYDEKLKEKKLIFEKLKQQREDITKQEQFDQFQQKKTIGYDESQISFQQSSKFKLKEGSELESHFLSNSDLNQSSNNENSALYSEEDSSISGLYSGVYSRHFSVEAVKKMLDNNVITCKNDKEVVISYYEFFKSCDTCEQTKFYEKLLNIWVNNKEYNSSIPDLENVACCNIINFLGEFNVDDIAEAFSH